MYSWYIHTIRNRQRFLLEKYLSEVSTSEQPSIAFHCKITIHQSIFDSLGRTVMASKPDGFQVYSSCFHYLKILPENSIKGFPCLLTPQFLHIIP